MADKTFTFPKQALLLAPMEDVTDISYRILCKEMGADVVYTEFVNSDGLVRKCKKAREKMKILPEERPAGIQIYGQFIDSMVGAAKLAMEFEPEILDINAGCWVKKVSGRGAGSGLLKDPPKLFEMVESIVKAVDVPVTVKTRLGWDETSINIPEIAKGVEDAGASALTVHCRTRSQGLTGIVDWSWIEKLKDIIKIPLFLNGGIYSVEDAVRAFEETPADGIMLAGGAIGRPWLFKEITHYLKHKEIPEEISLREKIDLLIRHFDLHIEHKGERRGIPSFRKYYTGYLKGIKNSSRLRRSLVTLTDIPRIKEILLEFAESGKTPTEISHAS
jgi:tRNA-dihydrouridine synthase B